MYKTTFLCILLLLSCKNQQDKTAASRYSYSIDTITSIYHYEFEGKWVGGQDILTQKGETWMFYNFCETGRLIIRNMQRDSVISLLAPYVLCEEFHSDMKKDKILVLTPAGELFSYSDSGSDPKLLLHLKDIPDFANSGMVPEIHRPGGDQRHNIPENVFYFRVNQDFGNTKGKYSKHLFAYPLTAKLDLKTRKVEFFGAVPEYVTDNAYGLLSNVYDLYTGDSIIYSNPVNGNLEIINTLNRRTNTLKGSSSYQLKEASKFIFSPDNSASKQLKYNHSLYSGKYEPLFYNPNEERYYRLYHPEMQQYNEKGLLNTVDDKLTVLMIFNKNLELEDEVMLPVKGNQLVKIFPFTEGVGISIQNAYQIKNGISRFSLLRIRRK